MTNRALENKIQSGIIKTDISDHFPIFTVFKTNETWSLEKRKFIKRDISSKNIDTFKFLLENMKWDNILPAKSPDKAHETFLFIFSDLDDTAFPKREIEIKTQPLQSPWITRSLQTSSKRKQRLYEIFLENKQLKMKLHIFGKFKENLKQVIISTNPSFLKVT